MKPKTSTCSRQGYEFFPSITKDRWWRRLTMLAARRHRDFPRCNQYNVHYLAAYLSAVTGCLRQRGMMIHTAVLTPSPQPLSCRIAFSPPRQPVGFIVPAWEAHSGTWDEYHGWCCELHHIANNRALVRRYLNKSLAPAPEIVADFVSGLSRVQTLGDVGAAELTHSYHRTSQELADDLIQFIPTCSWIG